MKQTKFTTPSKHLPATLGYFDEQGAPVVLTKILYGERTDYLWYFRKFNETSAPDGVAIVESSISTHTISHLFKKFKTTAPIDLNVYLWNAKIQTDFKIQDLKVLADLQLKVSILTHEIKHVYTKTSISTINLLEKYEKFNKILKTPGHVISHKDISKIVNAVPHLFK